jgi:hypothetical protein
MIGNRGRFGDPAVLAHPAQRFLGELASAEPWPCSAAIEVLVGPIACCPVFHAFSGIDCDPESDQDNENYKDHAAYIHGYISMASTRVSAG